MAINPAYRDAIASIESAGSGDYSATGPVTRSGDKAYGRYQVMGANIGPWTQQVLGRRMTPQEFLANPQAQDAVFDAIFGGYVDRYGLEGAARAWFTGSPTGRGSDQLGTTADEYARRVVAHAGGAQPSGMAANRMNQTEQPQPNPNVAVLEAIRTKRQERGLKTPLLDGLISRLGKQSFEDRANDALQAAQDYLDFDPAQNGPQNVAPQPVQAPEAAEVTMTPLVSSALYEKNTRAGARGQDQRLRGDWNWANQTIEEMRGALPETPPPPPSLERQQADVARLLGSPTMNGSMLPGGFSALPPSMGFSPTTPPWVQAPNYQVNPANLPPPIIRALMN